MNIDQALAYGQEQLKDSDSPYLDARLLIEYVTGASHSQMIAHPDRDLHQLEINAYLELIQRASKYEPIPYLVGSAPFYGHEFIVNPAVLIPRPETELLVDSVVEYLRETGRQSDKLSIVDVGTGSGCIAITLATILPNADIVAVDITEDALNLAEQNALRHSVRNRISFLNGDLLLPIDFKPNIIVANLPYVAENEWPMLDQGVRLYEPEVALKGGSIGIERISALLEQAKDRLAPGGRIFLEIGWQQGLALRQVAASLFPRATISVRSDLSDLDRILSIDTGPHNNVRN